MHLRDLLVLLVEAKEPGEYSSSHIVASLSDTSVRVVVAGTHKLDDIVQESTLSHIVGK